MILRIVILLMIANTLAGQEKPAQWHVSVVRPDSLKGNEVVLKLTSDLQQGWEVYASGFEAPIGPLPTKLILDGKEITSIGELRSDKPLYSIDPAWSIGYTYFEDKATFYQCVRLAKPGTKVRGKIKGQYINKKNRHVRDFEEKFVVDCSLK